MSYAYYCTGSQKELHVPCSVCVSVVVLSHCVLWLCEGSVVSFLCCPVRERQKGNRGLEPRLREPQSRVLTINTSCPECAMPELNRLEPLGRRSCDHYINGARRRQDLNLHRIASTGLASQRVYHSTTTSLDMKVQDAHSLYALRGGGERR